ncbi:MAG TPA: NAD-dependent epimerase/dehydratase family protein [Streptosporangiaceae bacterium]|nr:NAD-dependent epimerase/dehydratase family protein [Streptosporangiaceae bacterium]
MSTAAAEVRRGRTGKGQPPGHHERGTDAATESQRGRGAGAAAGGRRDRAGPAGGEQLPGAGPPAGREPGSGPRARKGRGSAAAGKPQATSGPAGAQPAAAQAAATRPATDRPARGRPAAGPGPVVAVTGAAHGLGHALAARLAVSAGVGRVVAIDDHRGDVAGVTWRLADVRDPALAGRLAGVDVLVHTDVDLGDSDYRARRAFNVRAAQTVLTAAAAGRVASVILVTSAMVYGARPDNPVPLAESAPLAADTDGSVAGDLLEIEHLAERSPRTHPGMAVTVVRPAALVGDGVDTLVARHFEGARLLTVKGCPQRWQFCHIDDLVSALELAVAGEVTGNFAVGCDGWLELAEVEEISGLRRIELPAALTLGTAQRLHRIGIAPAPINDLRYLVYPWVVDCRTLRDAGWRPAYDNAAVLRALMDVRALHRAAARRIPRKEAAITAAGATVAVIGTAAIVRAARRRRSGGG